MSFLSKRFIYLYMIFSHTIYWYPRVLFFHIWFVFKWFFHMIHLFIFTIVKWFIKFSYAFFSTFHFFPAWLFPQFTCFQMWFISTWFIQLYMWFFPLDSFMFACLLHKSFSIEVLHMNTFTWGFFLVFLCYTWFMSFHMHIFPQDFYTLLTFHK